MTGAIEENLARAYIAVRDAETFRRFADRAREAVAA